MMQLLAAVFALGGVALLAGLLLGFTALHCKTETNPIVTSIDALLPQTQCGQCGYPGCAPYAAAVAQGEAINKCVPGGQAVVHQLADLLHIAPPTPAAGIQSTPAQPIQKVALIDEAFCIGCTKCLQACPVDAIVGTTKALHTVLTDLCTGCDLCVPTCPTDCISMIPLDQLTDQPIQRMAAHCIAPQQPTV